MAGFRLGLFFSGCLCVFIKPGIRVLLDRHGPENLWGSWGVVGHGWPATR